MYSHIAATSLHTFIQQLASCKSFLSVYHFSVLSITENIGHRAMIYMEQYALSHGLTAGDAIIAATAAENDLLLVSGNEKHFRMIPDIKLKIFRPT